MQVVKNNKQAKALHDRNLYDHDPHCYARHLWFCKLINYYSILQVFQKECPICFPLEKYLTINIFSSPLDMLYKIVTVSHASVAVSFYAIIKSQQIILWDYKIVVIFQKFGNFWTPKAIKFNFL